jgi:5'-nucleotidase
MGACDPQLQPKRHLTILATNDIHGSVEPQDSRYGPVGGMAFWSGVVRSIRQGISQKYGRSGGVLVVDSGDQFQGTLLSNYSEGELVFDTMNAVGYDAAITGNHDYDFGPKGWLDDKVNSKNPDKNPRSVIETLAQRAKFPLVSANTFLRASIRDAEGNPIEVDNSGCTPKAGSPAIDWSRAERPSFLQPYVIKKVAGVRVAIIGIDNPSTPQTTTPENVSDLCFRNEFESYRDVRAELQGKADVFIMLLHDGDASNEFNLTTLLNQLAALPGYEPGHAVDAILAGHTHFVNNVSVHGIPGIQDSHNGQAFGRIDLVWDAEHKTLSAADTRQYAGVYLDHEHCDKKAEDAGFCAVIVPQTAGARPTVAYEGVPVVEDAHILDLVARAKKDLAPMAERIVGTADQKLDVDRISESPLADALTDSFREVSGADIAFLNTGGLRTSIPAGPVRYADLFEVLPFSNHGLVVGPMTAQNVVSLLARSIRTCGNFGALMQSGLRVTYTRDCARAENGEDTHAQLTHVETLSGEVILDTARGIEVPANRTFLVATLDFLAAGGSGFTGFRGAPLIHDLGILREVLTEKFVATPAHWSGGVDGRWKQAIPSAR